MSFPDLKDELPEGWIWTNFNRITQIILGQSPPSNTYNSNGKGLPFFQGKKEFTDLYPIPEKWCSKPSKIAEPGDILLSVRAPVGATNLANIKCCIGRGLAAIRYSYCNKYLFFYLKLIEKELDKFGTGSTFKAISGETIRNIFLPLPPLPEQHRVVAKIEELFIELDAGVAALKKAKSMLETYRQAVLKAAFDGKLTQSDIETWELMTIGQVTYINPKLPINKYKDDLEVSFIPMKAVDEETGKFSLSERRKLKDVRKGYTPFINGDVIFAKITPCMENGKVAVLNNLINRIGFGSTEFHVFRCTDKIINKYLFYYLIQKSFRLVAESKMTGAVGQKRVPKLFLNEKEIPIPPINQQEEIVNNIEQKFNETFIAKNKLEQTLKNIEFLKQSILKQAFSGKLVPQNPDDEPAEKLLERIKLEPKIIR